MVARRLTGLGEPVSEKRFARAILVRSESQYHDCPLCGHTTRKVVPPAAIDWKVEDYEDGSDVIGDFTWHASSQEAVVSEMVRDILLSARANVAFHDVTMIQSTSSRSLKTSNGMIKAHVKVPYNGPPLWELEIKSTCVLDASRSKAQVESTCRACGHTIFRFSRDSSLWIDASTWDGSPVVKISGCGFIFVSNEICDTFLRRGVTNFSAKEEAYIDIADKDKRNEPGFPVGSDSSGVVGNDLIAVKQMAPGFATPKCSAPHLLCCALTRKLGDHWTLQARIVNPRERFRVCAVCSRAVWREEAISSVVWEPPKWFDGCVGDMTWHADNQHILVSMRLKSLFEELDANVAFSPVCEATTPTDALRGIKLPQWEMSVRSICSIDKDKSKWLPVHQCEGCGTVSFETSHDSDIWVDPSTWDGSHVFTISEYPFLCVTDAVRERFESDQITSYDLFNSGVAILIPE